MLHNEGNPSYDQIDQSGCHVPSGPNGFSTGIRNSTVYLLNITNGTHRILGDVLRILDSIHNRCSLDMGCLQH